MMKKNEALQSAASLVDRYEEIRISFLEAGFYRNISGTAILLREGMASWMDTAERHWDDILPVKRDCVDAWRLDLDRQNEMVCILSQMTLRSLEGIV
jgi:hypothetical protein